MYSIIIGYASFYLVRQNFSLAIPAICSDLGYTKSDIGIVITIGAIIYGIGKCLFGMIGDTSRAKYMMVIGLLLSAMANICLGFSSIIPSFMIFWALNNCFQSMGWPPCAKLLTHWFSPVEIATRWAVWNTSQQIGGAVVAVLAPFLLVHFGWRYVFFVPGLLAIGLAAFLFNRLRDTPESLKLPSVEKMTGFASATEKSKKWESDEETKMSYKKIVKMALWNKFVWCVGLANFFVYICRMMVFYWGPTFLLESKGISLTGAGMQMAVFDVAGMFGGICAGLVSDKIFKGRRGPVSATCMAALSITVFLLWLSPAGNYLFSAICMMCIGFLVTGPQILVGVAASDFSSKKAAATASGFTGTLGYAGTAFAGWGIGFLADNYGWNSVFLGAIFAGILSAALFAMTWNAKSKVLTETEKA
jgi:phosphoglycerate transporter family protein